MLPYLFRALEKKHDPDHMKGALYVLWNKGTAAYALAGKTKYTCLWLFQLRDTL